MGRDLREIAQAEREIRLSYWQRRGDLSSLPARSSAVPELPLNEPKRALFSGYMTARRMRRASLQPDPAGGPHGTDGMLPFAK
jgi:hypothetical protein